MRKSWNLTGCLALANPLALNPEDLDEDGKPKVHRKTEIRGITHLHHALDACVLAFASHIRPHKVWHQLEKLPVANGGNVVRVLRIGSFIRIAERTKQSGGSGSQTKKQWMTTQMIRSKR